MSYFFPCVLAFLVAVNAANGLRCYTCNSLVDVSCESAPFESAECTTSQCYKVTVAVKDGTEFTERGCMPEKKVDCYTIEMGMKLLFSARNTECNTCTTDNCNSAQRITGVTFVWLILAAAIFVF